MAYLIGVILVLLLIALVLVFRPPKPMVHEDEEQSDLLDSEEPADGDSLALDAEKEESATEDTGDSVLTFDEPDEVEAVETGVHEEEELSLTFDEPENDQGVPDESADELVLDLEEESVDGGWEGKSVAPDEELYLDLEEKVEHAEEDSEVDSGPVAEITEPLQDESEQKDNDIPLIEEDEDSLEQKGEMAPALADVPDDYAELDEDEAPEELAERLEYFLGPEDKEEAGPDVEEPGAEPVEESGEEELLEEELPPVSDNEAEVDYAEEQPEEMVPATEDEGEEDIVGEAVPAESERTEELPEEQLPEPADEAEGSEPGDTSLELDKEVRELSDIADDFVALDEEVVPEEIAPDEAEVGEEETALEATEQETEPIAEEIFDEEKEDFAEEEELAVEEEPVVEAGPEEIYGSWLAEQIAKLQTEMNDAIQTRETGKLGTLGMALENLYTKQADVSTSFQIHQKMLDGVEGMMVQLQHTLPGFQLEAAKAGLRNGEYEVVQAMLAEAVKQLDDSPQIAAMALYYWGRFDEEQGDFEAAREMFDKGCSIDTENQQCIFSSGRLARIAGDMDRALTLLEQRVASGVEQGEDSVEMARARYELAKTLAAMDSDPERVEHLLQQSLESVEKALGAANPNLGPVLHELAAFHDSAGRYEQAEPLYKRALEVVEQALGSDSPRLGLTLNKLAGLYEEIEQAEKSEPLYRRALDIRQKVLGENHPDIGSIMGHLANLLKTKGLYDQAEPLYKKSLEIAEVALGKDHPNLAMVYNELADLYGEMGDQEQAEYFGERAFAAFGMPGMGDGFVEMEKDTGHDEDDDNEQTIAGD